MKGLAPRVSNIFDTVSRLECIKPFVLVGGTALSLQIGHRQSEDLDFMRWKVDRNDKLEIGWNKISKELETIGNLDNVEVLGFDQALFVLNGVKLSFYAAPRKRIPNMQEICIQDNLRVADIKSIGAMKLEIMLRRSRFRDYYDIYSILKEGIDLKEMVSMAIEHSSHRLKEKNLLAMLTSPERYQEEKNFKNLSPKYAVTGDDIKKYIEHKYHNFDLRKQLEVLLAETALIYKAKNGDMMIRASIGESIISKSLTLDEFQNIVGDKRKISELAVKKLSSEALVYLDNSSKELHL